MAEFLYVDRILFRKTTSGGGGGGRVDIDASSYPVYTQKLATLRTPTLKMEAGCTSEKSVTPTKSTRYNNVRTKSTPIVLDSNTPSTVLSCASRP
jgi:hypothetical protein